MNDEEIIEIPSGVTEIKKKEFSNPDKLKIIKLPEGLEKIWAKAFENCTSLKTIEIPESVTEIFSYAFINCSNLKKIKLPEGLKRIGGGAFENCTSLETIEIPESVTEIEDYVFIGCGKLKRIKLPNGIVTIPERCFVNCKDLEQIILPNKLKTIDDKSFSNCASLKNIVIPNGVEHIGKEAFYGCCSLKKIIIPSSVTSIGYQWFGGSWVRDIPHSFTKEFKNKSNIETIIINYDSYPKLKKFIQNNQEFLADILDDYYPQMHLYFAGPKLSFFQKIKLQRLFEGKNVTFLEGQVPIENPKNFDEKIDVSNLDEDIQKIVNEINELCSKLSNENRIIINNKINKLLNEYKSNKQKLKPKYGEKRTTLSMDSNNVSTLKPQLLSNLEMIKLNLSTEDKLIKFLSELDSYKEILNQEIKELSPEQDSSIENMINNIIYYCNFVDSSKKQEFISKLKKYIDNAIKESSDELINVNNQQIVLDKNEKLDTKMQLKLDISKLYDEVEKYANKVKPFQELLNALNTEETVEKEKFGDGILEMINGIRYVITHLSDSKYQDELEDKYAKIVSKYSSIIKKLFKNPEELSRFKYEELENNLREELHPLLELMNNYAYLDSYEINKANNNNLLSQLYSCLDVIEGKEIVAINNEQRLEPLTSTIIELNNDILNYKEIDETIRNSIILELSAIINQSINSLKENNIETLDEYNLVQREILGKFMEVKIKMEQYIHDLNEYNEHVR